MDAGLNAFGITFIVIAWGVVIGLLAFCFRKILSTPGFDED